MILDEIASKTIYRIEKQKQKVSFSEIRNIAEKMNSDTGFPFEKAVRGSDISFICEVKKASPSKGVISKDFPYMNIASEYEKGGASAISVLTEPYYFMGKNEYLKRISEVVNIPILRKDFTVDSYMIYEAKTLGASAVLLICAILDQYKLCEYIKIANSIGLSAIAEVHVEKEIETALNAGARIIGVNNRNLKNFSVDINTSIKLRNLVPNDVIFIAESGIKNSEDIKKLQDIGTNAILIGETLMKSSNRANTLRLLKEGKSCAV